MNTLSSFFIHFFLGITIFIGVFLGYILVILRGHSSKNGPTSVSYGLICVLVLSLALVVLVLLFSYAYIATGIINTEDSIVKDPKTCMYFSAVTFTTLGYGDFRPTPKARGIAAAEAVLGYIFLGLFVATVVHMLQKIGHKSTKLIQNNTSDKLQTTNLQN